MNEVVNGLVRSGATCELATIPIGTGMDFVRTHGISTKFAEAVGTARDGDVRTVDVGRVSYRTWDGADAERYVANVGSVGMSAAVAQRANGMSKALGGRTTFFYALVRVFLEWENTVVSVELDGGERREGRMHDVVVANGQYHGGAMWLAPDAQPDDGLFDVLLIGDVTKRDFVTTAPKLYRGTHVTHPKIEVIRSKVVSVDARGAAADRARRRAAGDDADPVRDRAGRGARPRASALVPLPVVPSSFWVASTKRCKDAGSAHSGSYGRDRGRRSAPRDRGPEAGMHCWKGH